MRDNDFGIASFALCIKICNPGVDSFVGPALTD